MSNDPPNFDIYVTGGDQVWNTNSEINCFGAYFLPFGPKSTPRISLSSSLGANEFNIKYIDWIKEHLSNYRAISVRENNDVEYLKSLGYNNCIHIADPSILANKRIYDELISNQSHSHYDVVTYILGKKSTDWHGIDKQIHSIMGNGKCSMLNIALQDFKLKHAKNRILSVPEFVDAIANCDLLITNSFHGVVFANIYNKPYVYIKFPDEKKNARVSSLLKGSEDEFRMVDSLNQQNLENLKKPLKLDLSLLRIAGLNFLRENLK